MEKLAKNMLKDKNLIEKRTFPSRFNDYENGHPLIKNVH